MCTELPTGPTDPKPDDEWGKTLHIFEVHRDYIKHENELVNHRVTMMIALNSLLFAAVSIILSTGGTNEVALIKKGFIFLMAIAGATGTAFSGIAAFAAHLAMQGVRDSWENSSATRLEYRTKLPKIDGGGSKKAIRYGRHGFVVTAALLTMIWAIVACAAWDSKLVELVF